MADKRFLMLGGGGMIGFQIARRICKNLKPRKMVIVSLTREEVERAVQNLRAEFPQVELVGCWGDIFTRSTFNRLQADRPPRRADLLASAARRAQLFEDIFGDVNQAYARSQLVQLILEHQPEVIIDSINTATAISYQDVFSAAQIAHNELHSEVNTPSPDAHSRERLASSLESLIISQYIPQLIRHIELIYRAMREAQTRLYLKIGTTGTGGMGLNIPYTHGEDKPSAKLMAKTAVAFAHTGLLFLMARTRGGPVVKEIKPAALVGWTDTDLRTITRRGRPAGLFACQEEPLGEMLALRLDPARFERRGVMRIPVADTGENGVFTKGEFETITAMGQMELITPEEIAQAVELEVVGKNTGADVITAVDSTLLGPTYRGGLLRKQAIDCLNRLEAETGIPSVALGKLGPPELSKLLWEAYLFKQCYGTLSAVTAPAEGTADSSPALTPETLSSSLHDYLKVHTETRDLIASTGVPILLPDGRTLLRGPDIRIPEVPGRPDIPITPADIGRWADKGWVDLRPKNMARWQSRFQRMCQSQRNLNGKGSAAIEREAYLFNHIYIGEVVGWIFNNEMGGFRIKQ